MIKPDDLKKGAELPAFRKTLDRASIDLYARASGDLNPIHVDEEFARQTRFGGIIAHGMLVLSCIGQMLTAAFGSAWFDRSELYIRFKAPARPGDTLSANGIIRDIRHNDEGIEVVCSISCRNQKGEPVIIGEAKVKIRA